MKKKFEYMSTNEWLGDMTTHFMKSGEALRSPANTQESLSQYIPRLVNGVKVEYDIAYDIPGKIHGYKYSDFLTKAIHICPQSFVISRNIIAEVASRETTEEGCDVFQQLRDTIEDKYIQLGEDSFVVDELVVLPGTNLLVKDDIVDMEKIDELVRKGAYVKLHPITERTWCNFLKQRWGKNVIDGDVPLYPLLRGCKKVWFTMSSETGFAAAILGKQIGLVNRKDKKAASNFEHIYAGLDRAKNGSIAHKITVLLSHPESGILTTYHADPQTRINRFFEYTSSFPHK
jgi:hypothetical protein